MKNNVFDKIIDWINNNDREVINNLGIVIVIIFLIPIILICTAICHDNGFDMAKVGQIGDVVGGITNPLVAIIAIFFSFLAFYIQYKANKQVQDQFNNERTLSLVFKAIQNKDNLITYAFNKDGKLVFEDEIKKLSKDLEDRIINDLMLDFVHNPEKHKPTNKFIELLISRISKENEDEIKKRREEKFYRKHLIEYFIDNESTRVIKENKVGEASVYLLIQLIVQENLSFIYSYVAQINFILTQIEKLNESEQLYHYFFGTLKNEEICLLLYLYLYSIPNKRGLSLIILERIDINAKFVEQLQKSNISLNYTNQLLVGEITINSLIEEIKRIQKYCEEHPVSLE